MAKRFTGNFNGCTWEAVKQACEEGLAVLDAGSVPLVIADPPYNLKVKYDKYEDDMKEEDYLKLCETWLRSIYRVLRPDGTLFFFMWEKTASEVDVLAKRLGFIKRSRIIWYYTFGQNQKENFTPSHVAVFYYVKGKKFIFNKDDPEIRVPSARQLVYGDKRANPKGRLPDNVWLLIKAQYEGLVSPLDDFWLDSRICGTFKERVSEGLPCQLPASVLDRMILLASNPGDLVLDPFCGTGSTAVQAVRRGRNALTYDISDFCIETAVSQLKGLKE